MDPFENQRAHNKAILREQTSAEWSKLQSDIQDMQEELRSGSLSLAARKDLESMLVNTRQAADILRNSLRALAHEDIPEVIQTADSPLTAEIKDPEKHLLHEYRLCLEEIQSLRRERELLKELLSGEEQKTRLQKMDQRIESYQAQAEYLQKQLDSFGQ